MTIMANGHLGAVLLLLERMTLTDAEAARVQSAIRTGGARVLPDSASSITDVEDFFTPPPTAEDVALASLKDLVITTNIVDGQTHYQKTYRDFTFDIPKPNATGPFYLVTRGRRVGIFSTLQRTNPHVQGVSLASYSRVSSVEAGLLGMADAIDHFEAEWLI